MNAKIVYLRCFMSFVGTGSSSQSIEKFMEQEAE